MKYRKFFSIPVVAVFSFMGFVYYLTVLIFIEDWVGLKSSSGSLNAIIFTFLASLCLFSFVVGVLTEPGQIPSSYLPDVEDSFSVSDQEPKKNGAQSKFCDKCAAYKPPRAHHCRVCRKCILRMVGYSCFYHFFIRGRVFFDDEIFRFMVSDALNRVQDHHCLWINNCVGYWNYKAFFTLVLYATLASIYSTVIVISCSCQKDWKYSGTTALKIFYFAYGAMMLALFATLGTLLGWHIYLITHNMTTIEYYEGVRAAWLAKKSGLSYRHPFDLGVYKNITLVLGPNMLRWLWPISVSHLKDGISFPTLRDSS